MAETLTNTIDEFPLISYGVEEEFLRKLAEKYGPLTINGLNDKEGLIAVHNARMDLRGLRTDIDKRRKELKSESLAWGKRVDSEAKRLTALIQPVEDRLKEQEDAVKAEQDRLKSERSTLRLQALQAVCLPGTLPPVSMIESLSDEEFAALLEAETRAHETRQAEEQARLEREAAERAELERLRAEEQARLKAEAEKQAADRAELDRQRAELADQQQALRAQQEAVEAAERERQAVIERERLQAEAVELARKEVESQRLREAAEAEAAEAEAQRQAALRPDREKLASVADALDAIIVPDVGPELQTLRQEIADKIIHLATWVWSRTSEQS